MDDAFRTLYAWVRETREILFSYCDAMDLADYTYAAPDMGWNSIRNTHVHVAGCYWFWLARVLGEERPALEPELYPDVTAVRTAFAAVDDLVERCGAPLRTTPPGYCDPVRHRHSGKAAMTMASVVSYISEKPDNLVVRMSGLCTWCAVLGSNQ